MNDKSFFDSDGYKEAAERRLRAIIKKKCNTIFIGALADIEEFLGHLWGHDPDKEGNVDVGELTPEQREYYEIWQELRTSILDRGNFQLDNILKEINSHQVNRKVYKYNFKPKRHPNY